MLNMTMMHLNATWLAMKCGMTCFTPMRSVCDKVCMIVYIEVDIAVPIHVLHNADLASFLHKVSPSIVLTLAKFPRKGGSIVISNGFVM